MPVPTLMRWLMEEAGDLGDGYAYRDYWWAYGKLCLDDGFDPVEMVLTAELRNRRTYWSLGATTPEQVRSTPELDAALLSMIKAQRSGLMAGYDEQLAAAAAKHRENPLHEEIPLIFPGVGYKPGAPSPSPHVGKESQMEEISTIVERVVISTAVAAERLGLHQGSVARRCRQGKYEHAQQNKRGNWELLEAEVTCEEMATEVAAATEVDDQPFPLAVECEHCTFAPDGWASGGKTSPGPVERAPADDGRPPDGPPTEYYYSRAAGETREMRDRVMTALDEQGVIKIAYAKDHTGNPIWKKRQVFGLQHGRLYFGNGRTSMTSTINYIHK